MFCYQGWKIGDLSIIFLLITRCSTIKAKKQKACLSLFLLIYSINLGFFLHLCTHDIGWNPNFVSPKIWCDLHLLWALAGEGGSSCSAERQEHLWPLLPSSWLHHPGPWQHPWFLRRAWIPCPCLYPWPSHPLGLDHHLGWIPWKPRRFESLKFLEDSKTCKAKKNDSPGAPYIEGET